MRYRLVHDGRDILIGRGGAVIGRSAACKVLIDSDDVSRRHARLSIDGAVPRLEDLGSANGVSVNGSRVVEPVVLRDGDRIDVAGHEMVFVVEDASVSSSPRAPALEALWDDEEAASFDDGKDTRLTSGGSWLSAALAILRKGDASAALAMARPRLEQTLMKAREGAALDPDVGLEAATLAIELAVACAEGKWVTYVFALYGAAGSPMPEEVVKALESSELPSFDPAPARAYWEGLSEDPSSGDSTAGLRRRLETLLG
jgi:hypothetical protein